MTEISTGSVLAPAMSDIETKLREDEWPENPSAGWLGTWAAKQPHLPFEISLGFIRDMYINKRAAALRATLTGGKADA